MNKTTTDMGKVSKEADGFKVVFERTLNHPIEKVWDAITNPEKLKIWFTDFEMQLLANSPMKITFRDNTRTVTTGKVLEVNKPNRFVWSWEEELAVWELTALSDKSCKLVFTYSKLPDHYAAGAPAGFHSLLERLESYLGGNNRIYPFGTEEFDPESVALKEDYAVKLYDHYPELEQHHPIKLEKELHVSSARLWEVLTNNDILKNWYFDFKGNFKTEVGHVFEWYAGSPEKQWLHRAEILEVIEGKKLVHSWMFPGYSGEAKLTWEIVSLIPETSLLKLEFDFVEPFDFNKEALRRKNFVQGWKQFMFIALPAFLASNPDSSATNIQQ